MLSILKTAIITIIISFISGVLLDYYRNYAPRIVCNIGRTKVIKRDNKKEKIYFLTIRNISKKTIHDLNINITANCNNLKLHNSKITNGLKYDISNENNMYNISVPFLSKNDEFTTKVLLEEQNDLKVKPSISLRSPENFKRVDKSKADYFKDTNRESNSDKIEEILFRNKKVIIGVISVLVVAFAGIMVKEYYNNLDNNSKIYENTNNSSNILNSPSTNTNSNNNTANVVPDNNNLRQSGNEGDGSSNYDNSSNIYSTEPNSTLGDESETNEKQNQNDDENSNENQTQAEEPASGVNDTSTEGSSGNSNNEKESDGTGETSNNEDTSQNSQSSDDSANNNSTAGDEAGQGNSSDNPAPAASGNTETGNGSGNVNEKTP